MKHTLTALAITLSTCTTAYAGSCNDAELVRYIHSDGQADRQWKGDFIENGVRYSCRKSKVIGEFIVPRFAIECNYKGKWEVIGNRKGSKSYEGYFSTRKKDSRGRCKIERSPNWYFKNNPYEVSGYWDRDSKKLRLWLGNRKLFLYQVRR